PTYKELKAEEEEKEPKLVFTIKDPDGNVVKKEMRTPKKGVQRFNWDLRFVSEKAVNFNTPSFYNPFAGKDDGTLVEPGTYTVQMDLFKDGNITPLVSPVSFNVKALKNTTMPAKNREAKVAFQRDMAALEAKAEICQELMSDMNNKLKYIKQAIEQSELPLGKFSKDVLDIETKLRNLRIAMYGDPVKSELDIDQPISPMSRLGIIVGEQKYSTSTPTQTHRDSYAIAKSEIDTIKQKLETLYNVDVKQLEERLVKAGAPYTPGRGMDH
ncbi:MAG TPA: hypothetical protein VJ945_00170, partial [Flavobacteriaceae bacterium]|nr:hypothetical protein [Flavobacteriaceae bacterium]